MSAKQKQRPSPWPGTYVMLVATIAVLNVIGVVMVLSASSVFSIESHGSVWYTFMRQLAWTLLGVIGFAVAQRVDYRSWRRIVEPFVFVSGLMLVLVLVPHVGLQVAGARRWLGVSAWSVQPSELAKLALVVFAAEVLTRREDELHDWRRALRPVLLVLVAFAALVCLEPDFDSALLLGIIVGGVLLVGGIRIAHLATVGGVSAAAATVFALSSDYRRERLMSFLHPAADAANAGYQAIQSSIAIGSGGISGVGLGAGRAKWLFLPNAHTDFIFAVIGEELGLIGTFIVVGLFLAFLVLGTRAALRAPDRFGMLLATGITVWIGAQALLNIGGVIGLLPASSVPLPFVSFGGSALVVSMIAAGVLANVAKHSVDPLSARTRTPAAAAER
ncbi:MAG: putative lipid II flippase FtsW [Acidimicrobiia bacterium]|nr:putative lipid II flippase FtsW [Acidimicrobiia bacterium]